MCKISFIYEIDFTHPETRMDKGFPKAHWIFRLSHCHIADVKKPPALKSGGFLIGNREFKEVKILNRHAARHVDSESWLRGFAWRLPVVQ